MRRRLPSPIDRVIRWVTRGARRQAEDAATAVANGPAAVEAPVGEVPEQANYFEPRTLELPVSFYRASGSNPGHTSKLWRTVAPDLDEVVIKGRHRTSNSIMDADRVGQITADIERRLR